jgi:hypothetical protein
VQDHQADVHLEDGTLLTSAGILARRRRRGIGNGDLSKSW